MDSEFLTADDQYSTPQSIGKRKGFGPTGVILKLIAAATIACSFVQVLRGQCSPITVIQFWLSLFVGAAVQSAAGDCRSDAVEICLGSTDSRVS